MTEMGTQNRRNTPLWARANGEVERQNRSLLKILRIAQLEKKPWQEELQRFLLAYRSTPHATTGETPAKLLFGRHIRSKLPSFEVLNNMPVYDDLYVRDRDAARKQATKDYADASRNAAESDLEPGDTVLLKNTQPRDKLSPSFHPEPHTVIERHGDQVTLSHPQSNTIVKRNIQHTKRLAVPQGKGEGEEPDQPATNSSTSTPAIPTRIPPPPQPPLNQLNQNLPVTETPIVRPKRNAVPPARFKDFHTSFR